MVILKQSAFILWLLCGLVPHSALAHADLADLALDVGHGWNAPGATSARGRSEHAFNRELSGRLAEAAEAAGLRVRPINFDGAISSLPERARQAEGSQILLSVHHDSISEQFLLPWDWDGAAQSYTDVKRGFGLFISRRNPALERSLACASRIGESLRRAGFVPSPWHARKHAPADADNGVWYYDNLIVLHQARGPAVLFEAGVIKHREEELALRDPERQAAMVQALVAALRGCPGVRERPAPVSD